MRLYVQGYISGKRDPIHWASLHVRLCIFGLYIAYDVSQNTALSRPPSGVPGPGPRIHKPSSHSRRLTHWFRIGSAPRPALSTGFTLLPSGSGIHLSAEQALTRPPARLYSARERECRQSSGFTEAFCTMSCLAGAPRRGLVSVAHLSMGPVVTGSFSPVLTTTGKNGFS